MSTQPTTAPILHTERLELRAHRLEDFAHLLELWTDPQVVRHITGQPLSRQEVWSRLLRAPGHWALLGFGYWLAFEQGSGRFVGEVGLGRFKRELLQGQPRYDALPEAGWVLLPWAQGRGFAREAMTAVLGWRGEHLAGRETFCLIHPENGPSLGLAARLGFVPEVEQEDTVVLLRA